MAILHWVEFRQHIYKFLSVSLKQFPKSYFVFQFPAFSTFIIDLYFHMTLLLLFAVSFSVVNGHDFAHLLISLVGLATFKCLVDSSLCGIATVLGVLAPIATIVGVFKMSGFFTKLKTRITNMQCSLTSSILRAGYSLFVVLWSLRLLIFITLFLEVVTVFGDSILPHIVHRCCHLNESSFLSNIVWL